jgi:hypothetical protein
MLQKDTKHDYFPIITDRFELTLKKVTKFRSPEHGLDGYHFKLIWAF